MTGRPETGPRRAVGPESGRPGPGRPETGPRRAGGTDTGRPGRRPIPSPAPSPDGAARDGAPPAPGPGEGRLIRLTLAYDGSGFLGWQRQERGPTLQGTLEDALGRLCGHAVTVRASGRTDAGVHAEAQVASFRTTAPRTLLEIVRGGNHLLPPSMAITAAEEAPEGFDARFSARGKTYAYDFWTGAVRHPLLARLSWHVGPGLDWGAVAAALPHLEGERDFRCFRSAGGGERTTVRTIFSAALDEPAERLVRLTVSGSGFLRHMVRSIAGTLWLVGRGRLRPEDLPELIRSGDRRRAGPVAPPQGLRLAAVSYGPAPGRADRAEAPGARFPPDAARAEAATPKAGPAPADSPTDSPEAAAPPGPGGAQGPPSAMEDLMASELFRGLGPAALEPLAAVASARRFESGRRLFLQGAEASGFHLVAAGLVKVILGDSDGRERIAHLIRPGSLVGEAAAFRGGPYPASAEAVGDVRTLYFPARAFMGLVNREPGLALAMMGVLSERLHHFRSLVESGGRALPRRLAALLLDLGGGGARVELPVAKAQLAQRLGVAPESLSRALGRLKAAGAASEPTPRTLVVDPALLAAVSEGELET